jgi:hypothetical protein
MRALLLLLFTTVAFAQGKPALRVVVDGVGSEAAACGIQMKALESLAAEALKKYGLELSAEAKDPYLYLNVNAYRVLQGSNFVGCTTRLGVSVRASADAAPPVRGLKSKAGAYLVLCDAGRLLSGGLRDVAGAVQKGFEEDIKSCLAQLSY